MALGSYPSHRDYIPWMTQRLANRAPEYAYIRRIPWSISQQYLNTMSHQLQETVQQLIDIRYNSLLSTANIKLLDKLYQADLENGMEFSYTELANGDRIYTAPTVYATISGTEYQITIAERNDIETLAYDCLPSRIADGDTNYTYDEVIPRTTAAGLGAVTPNSIVVNGHLYVTVRDNTSWEYRALDRIYYPKCYITGTTRKGTDITEAVPLRYNGTFKTVNQWQEVTSIFVSYIDSTATITIETFPWDTEGYLDTRNIYVPVSGGERIGFLRIDDTVYGSVLYCETFTSANMDIVRAGLPEKESFYKIELLNNAGNTITATGYTPVPFTRFMYVVDSDTLYVYDTNFPLPDMSDMVDESPNAKIDIYSDAWVFARGDTATLKTRNRTVSDVPYQTRWTLKDPDGDEYYMTLDGSLWPTSTDAWIANLLWDEGNFREQEIQFTMTKTGNYVLTLEAQYINEKTNTVTTLTTKFLAYVPSIQPEVTLSLPSTLRSVSGISIDSDGNIWLKRYTGVDKLSMYFDYFIADYENNRIWLKEEYSSVRIQV